MVKEDTNYNLCPGGHGGFGYINSNDLGFGGNPAAAARLARPLSDATLEKKHGPNYRHRKKNHGYMAISNGIKKYYAAGGTNGFLGKSHSEETKEKMRKPKNVGSSNSQFGKMWITNGIESTRIMKEDAIPEGWRKGRKIKSKGTTL